MFDCFKNASVTCKEKKTIILYYFTFLFIILYDFISFLAFIDIKQTLRYKV